VQQGVPENASRVVPGLYQGGRPQPGQLAFDVLVLMAKEYQPTAANFPGVKHILYAPIEDDFSYASPEERVAIRQAATFVAQALRAKQCVLVTCNMGLNRSGVVSALAICRNNPKLPADVAIRLVGQGKQGELWRSMKYWYVSHATRSRSRSCKMVELGPP